MSRKLLFPAFGLVLLTACESSVEESAGPYSVMGGHEVALMPGTFDPKAPPGFPLAIGDTISWSRWRDLEDEFPKWEGNRVVSKVDGIYYTPLMKDVVDWFAVPMKDWSSLPKVLVFVGMERALSRAEYRASLPPVDPEFFNRDRSTVRGEPVFVLPEPKDGR